jgi:hypothetical protein
MNQRKRDIKDALNDFPIDPSMNIPPQSPYLSNYFQSSTIFSQSALSTDEPRIRRS